MVKGDEKYDAAGTIRIRSGEVYRLKKIVCGMCIAEWSGAYGSGGS